MAYCPACNGTGRDDEKTRRAAKEDAMFRHQMKHYGSYVQCWACNGNGLEPPYPGRPYPDLDNKKAT